MRLLTPTECHMYLDEQQYFIGVVLDISRTATAVKGTGDVNTNTIHLSTKV